MNKNRNKLNQPPTEQGKKQSPRPGEPNKLNKRGEVLQATDSRQNIGTGSEETAAAAPKARNLKEAGR
jgi:hypothetical protein